MSPLYETDTEPKELVAEITKEYWPEAVGVPVIAPVTELRLMPAGSVPEEIEYDGEFVADTESL
jgi:hypothetical protein